MRKVNQYVRSSVSCFFGLHDWGACYENTRQRKCNKCGRTKAC